MSITKSLLGVRLHLLSKHSLLARGSNPFGPGRLKVAIPASQCPGFRFRVSLSFDLFI